MNPSRRRTIDPRIYAMLGAISCVIVGFTVHRMVDEGTLDPLNLFMVVCFGISAIEYQRRAVQVPPAA